MQTIIATCRKPKILASGIRFEASPECLEGEYREWRPDVIIGECIEGIGDSTKHSLAPRVFKKTIGFREKGYGPGGNYSKMPKNTTLFPLWNAPDYRQLEGGRQIRGHGNLNTAFHIHNFFENCDTLRFKYTTYG
jgi:hypothetical protein